LRGVQECRKSSAGFAGRIIERLTDLPEALEPFRSVKGAEAPRS